MRMIETDIIETYSYLLNNLKCRFPNMAYLHAIQPDRERSKDLEAAGGDSLAFLVSRCNPITTISETYAFQHKIWTHQFMILAGSYTPQTARQEAEARPNALIGFGRYFISNVSELPIFTYEAKESAGPTKTY
jgi:NADPH2 dehydrogenase